ncbi:hypothetical protein BC937DRAFT_91031 [Endogone sp. FLAS-F59071]|nr:hypothetical protein BC937DRAFT_91031 [Endogone sp. FLAS-F59071]|eukprot:RUS16582.1 hypothetical protein BC937DRAFT_91031 [Endogone sp. FLAS-F59071]
MPQKKHIKKLRGEDLFRESKGNEKKFLNLMDADALIISSAEESSGCSDYDGEYQEELEFIYAPLEEEQEVISSDNDDFRPTIENRSRKHQRHTSERSSQKSKIPRPFTREEDERLWQAVLQYGGSWTQVARKVGNNRTACTCKARMNTLKKYWMKVAGWN